MDRFLSAADFELGVSSLNGSSNGNQFGFLDLKGSGGTITASAVDSYLADTSNYTVPASIGLALGADVANDDHNNFDAAGALVSGTGSTNDTWVIPILGQRLRQQFQGFVSSTMRLPRTIAVHAQVVQSVGWLLFLIQ